MKKLFCFFVAILLLGCVPPKPVEEREVIEKIMIQCWDGSVSESIEKCPPQPKEEKPVEEIRITEPIEEAVEEPKPAEVKAEKPVLQELLEKVPDTYWFWDEDAGLGAVVSGFQRRFIVTLYDGGRIAGWGVADAYWNTQTGEILVYGGKLSEACLESTSDENPTDLYYRSKDAKFVDVYYKTSFSQEELPKSPVDWLIEYQHEVPVEIRDAKEVIKSPLSAATMTIDLVVKLNKKQASGFWVFKINRKLGVPLMVEDFSADSKTVKRHKYEFDTISHDSFNRLPLKELVQIDPTYKIISEEDFKEYETNRWCWPGD